MMAESAKLVPNNNSQCQPPSPRADALHRCKTTDVLVPVYDYLPYLNDRILS